MALSNSEAVYRRCSFKFLHRVNFGYGWTDEAEISKGVKPFVPIRCHLFLSLWHLLSTFDFWQLELQGRVSSSRRANGLVYSLWSLLPSFCNYPLDTAESFKDLEKALCSALHEEPDTRGIICSSLQILIQQNKRILGEKSEMPDLEDGTAGQRAVSRYTPQVASDNLSALRSSARELLNVLSGVFLQSTKDDGGSLQVLN